MIFDAFYLNICYQKGEWWRKFSNFHILRYEEAVLVLHGSAWTLCEPCAFREPDLWPNKYIVHPLYSLKERMNYPDIKNAQIENIGHCLSSCDANVNTPCPLPKCQGHANPLWVCHSVTILLCWTFERITLCHNWWMYFILTRYNAMIKTMLQWSSFSERLERLSSRL